MNYQYLAQVGASYVGEEGHPGHRAPFLDSVAAQLRNARVQLAAAEAAAKNPAPFAGSVRDRAAAFGNIAATRAAAEMLVHKRRDTVRRCEAVIKRMGARVDAQGQIDWGTSYRTVAYDHTLAAQGMTRVRFNGGRLFMDDAHKFPLNTRGMVTANMGPGYAIYVMSGTGNLHVSSHSVGDRHHSSLLAGGMVAGAGELLVTDGTLKWISNKSGHYFPESQHLLQTLHSLRKKGVALDSVKLNFLFNGGPAKGTPYTTVQAFLDAKQAEGVPDFEYAKLLRYLVVIPRATFDALAATRGWRWVNDAEYNAGGRGLVTNPGGIPVPHRDVRKWLKGLGRHAVPEIKPR